MVYKINPSLDYNYWYKHTNGLNKPVNQNSIKVLKVIKPKNEKALL